jgi:hypothetical protein
MFVEPIPVKRRESKGFLRSGRDRALTSIKSIVGSIRKLKSSRESSFEPREKKHVEAFDKSKTEQKPASQLTVDNIEDQKQWEDKGDMRHSEHGAETSSIQHFSPSLRTADQIVDGEPFQWETVVVKAELAPPRFRKWSWDIETTQNPRRLKETQEKINDSTFKASGRDGLGSESSLRTSEEFAEEYTRALDRHPSLSEENVHHSRALIPRITDFSPSPSLKLNAGASSLSSSTSPNKADSHPPKPTQQHLQGYNDRSSTYTTWSGIISQAKKPGGSLVELGTPANESKLSLYWKRT